MLLTVKDAAGLDRTIVAQAQEEPVVKSGTLASDNWALLSAENPIRSGFSLQNIGGSQMRISDQPEETRDEALCWVVAPGGYWPPSGYPATTGPLYIQGTAGDSYVGREW